MLTKRQQAVLDFIRQYQRDEQIPPSTRVVQARFRKAHSTVRQHLAALAAKGQIEQFADRRWGVKAKGVQVQILEVPVLGSIPAGLPALQEQQVEEHVGVDFTAFGIQRPRAQRYFALRVSGDSMIGDHILSGDLVLCEWREPRLGDILAALVDETTTTLKRVVKERGRIILKASNPRFPDIVPEQLAAQGVVLGVLRLKIA